MKTLVATTLLALTGSLAIAQQHNSISRSINDDGKTLSIRINGTMDGKPINYDRTFDVSGMDRDERNTLRERVLDSLNVSMPVAPKPPIAPKPPRSFRQNSESVTIMSGDVPTISTSSGDNQAVAVGGKNPYTKEVKYNQDAEQLYLRYRFNRDGEDFTYERTINVRDKSQQERQSIIDGIEKEIGVPKAGK